MGSLAALLEDDVVPVGAPRGGPAASPAGRTPRRAACSPASARGSRGTRAGPRPSRRSGRRSGSGATGRPGSPRRRCCPPRGRPAGGGSGGRRRSTVVPAVAHRPVAGPADRSRRQVGGGIRSGSRHASRTRRCWLGGDPSRAAARPVASVGSSDRILQEVPVRRLCRRPGCAALLAARGRAGPGRGAVPARRAGGRRGRRPGRRVRGRRRARGAAGRGRHPAVRRLRRQLRRA